MPDARRPLAASELKVGPESTALSEDKVESL